LNRELSNHIYEKVKAAGYTTRKTVEQFYDPVEKTFLADRFIRGTCPVCKKRGVDSPNQYGDGCEVCGSTFSPTDLIEPRSEFSGATPVMKQSEHIYLKLEGA